MIEPDRLKSESKETGCLYRAGIVGLGYIGGGDQISGDAIGGQKVTELDGTHAEALSRNPRIRLVAGSSRDTGRRERFQARTGCKTYGDWKEMLDRENLDIVSIATYAPSHAEIAVACAERGVRAIYCEKPIATKIADAESMLAACRRAGAILVVNHNRRFNPNYRRLAGLIGEGRKLGPLTSASLRWGNGRLGNVGTHMIDALCMVTGRKVLSASGALDLSRKPDCRGPECDDPGGFGWLRLEGGLMASVDAADYGKGRPEIVVNGALGRAVTGLRGVEIRYWDGSADEWPAPATNVTSMDRAAAEIAAALDGQAPLAYDGAEAIHALETIVAIHASHAQRGAWVDLPLKGDERRIEVRSG